MFSKVVILASVMVSAFGTTVLAMGDIPMANSSIESRTNQRRLKRLDRSSSSSSVHTTNYTRYRIIESTSSKPSTLLQRTQERLTARLNTTSLRSPQKYDTAIVALQRRENRRVTRLETQAPSIKEQVITGVNMERATRGIAALRYHRDLELSAQAHAQDMFDRDYFSHENPEGQRSGDRIKKTGYGVVNAQECHCSYKVFLGENIAKGQTSVEQVIREWMQSPSHKEAILSRDYRDIGVGIINNIWVLNFGAVEINPAK